MRTVHLAALAVAAAVAGCSVETNSLKPKTDAECAAADPTTKACGYKCVSASDPATGCATPGVCTPCEGVTGPHIVPTCVSGACQIVCEYGWGNCNGSGTDGCETAIFANDGYNCGACGRTCTACVNGACPGTDSGTAFGQPRGLVVTDTGLLYVADPQASSGSVRQYDGVAIATGLGAVRWLAPVSGQSRIIATGTTTTGSGVKGFTTPPSAFTCSAGAPCFSITEIDLSPAILVSTHPVAQPAVVGDHMEGLAAAGATTEYFFTYAGSDLVWSWDTSLRQTYAAVTASVGAKGLVAYGGKVFFGWNENGGEAWWVQPTGTDYVRAQVVGAGRPTRLAVFEQPTFFAGQPFLFWISGDDGSVRATLASGTSGVATLVPAVAGHPLDADVDIAADAQGVYWVDGATGKVSMWRAADDRVVPVGYSTSPFSVSASGGWIYWTDASTNKLYYAEKPALAVP